MKILALLMGALLGAVIGFVLGSVGVYYACVLIDKIQYPNGIPAGGGVTAVGWIFCFFTIPAGTFWGSVLGFRIAKKRSS